MSHVYFTSSINNSSTHIKKFDAKRADVAKHGLPMRRLSPLEAWKTPFPLLLPSPSPPGLAGWRRRIRATWRAHARTWCAESTLGAS